MLLDDATLEIMGWRNWSVMHRVLLLLQLGKLVLAFALDLSSRLASLFSAGAGGGFSAAVAGDRGSASQRS